MASYKSNSAHKGSNSKAKSKYGSEGSRNKISDKPKKEKTVTAHTKVIIRRLPPSMTEETFIESVAPLPEYDYMSFVNADSSLSSNAYCRAYINFKNVEDVYTFRDKFDGYVFVDQKGNEHPAMVEYAPFQKIPKRTAMKKKDARSGTIDEDADYLAFLESLNSPVTITLPPLEAVLEEIHAQDRELRANNGLIKVKTPLLEYIEQRKAEKLRSKEEKKEERRRKELERKRAREEERRKKKEMRELNREMRKEQQREERQQQREERQQHLEMKRESKDQKDDSSVKVLRPERGKDDYLPEGRMEKSRMQRDKERQRREEDKAKQRREKEKLRREREKEERYRRQEEKPRGREEEKSRGREEAGDDWQEDRHYGSKPEGSKSKRYSEGRRKEREKEKVKEEKEKEKEAEVAEEAEMETCDSESKPVEKVAEREKGSGRKRKDKDPRVERRIRNKDRPAMALYRPGQSRLSSRMRQDREEGVETSSSSPSPVMPVGDSKKSSTQNKKENGNSSRADSKEESANNKGNDKEADDDDSSQLKEETDKNTREEESAQYEEKQDEFSEEGKLLKEEKCSMDDKAEEPEADNQSHSTEERQLETSGEGDAENASLEAKQYPGVKSMTFRRSISRE